MAADLTSGPGGGLVRNMQEKLTDMEHLLEQQAQRAQDLMRTGDYSGAATACHRAHQAWLRIDLLRDLLS